MYICKFRHIFVNSNVNYNTLQYNTLRYNRNITLSVEDEGIDLQTVCLDLGFRGAEKNGVRGEPFVKAPPVTMEGLDLLRSLLAIDPHERVSATGALAHSFVENVPH